MHSLTTAHDLLPWKFFGEGIIRLSATQYPDWLYTSGFCCRAEICQDLSLQAYLQAQMQALRKASKYNNYQDPFRPFCIYGKARSRQTQHLLIEVLVEPMQTMVACNFTIVLIAKETRGGHVALISVKSMALLHFGNIVL